MNNNYLVTKSNHFIMHSSYDLSLEEQKLILTLASMVQPDDEEFKPYRFKISDFIKLLGIVDKSKYTEVPRTTKELMKKVFEIEEGNTILQVAWLSSASYEKGSGYVELEFSPKLKPYMLQLKEKFTQYRLANILSMKSKYSPRIYEILKCNEFKKQGYIEIEVEELRKLLKATEIYPRYNDFKRKVILQTQKELNKLSDISFEFEEIKTARKVTSLRFYIKQNNINKNECMNEISATISEDIEIKEVKDIINRHCNKKISDKSANEFYRLALGVSNDPLNLIMEVATYSTTQNIKNFNAWFKTMLKDYEKPEKAVKKSKFNNFTGHDYDYDELEKKLLGWD